MLLDDDDNNSDDKKLLWLLQLLQAQWVVGRQTEQQQQQQQQQKKNDDSSEDRDDAHRWRISVDSLLSQQGVSQLFTKAALLDAGDNPSSVEWVEMMTGSSRIVGRSSRSLVLYRIVALVPSSQRIDP